MSTASIMTPLGQDTCSLKTQGAAGPTLDEGWYAVFTIPKHEKSVLRYLDMRGIEAFLPTYETTRLWRNRQRVTLALPLFPCYLFVRASRTNYGNVRQSPGVIRLVGNQREPLPVGDSAIELLRASVAGKKIEPYHDLLVGTRVRVRNGPMQGVEGVLIRKNNALRFVLSIEMINQHAAIEMDAENLEPILTASSRKDRAEVEAGGHRNFPLHPAAMAAHSR